MFTVSIWKKQSLDIVDEYQIPNKNTPLHLLDTEFVFDDALELVQNLDLIQQNLWPENHYREIEYHLQRRKKR